MVTTISSYFLTRGEPGKLDLAPIWVSFLAKEAPCDANCNSCTRQWLPRNKIALLGKDKEFDSQKKMEGKTAALRKSVQKAYSRATLQAQNI